MHQSTWVPGRTWSLQRTGPAGADVLADRRDRRRRHHIAARGGRRRAQLGLPLHLDPGRQPHPGGTRGWPHARTRQGVLRLPRRGGRQPAQPGADLQIMYGVGGERDLTERELPHLPGWRGSPPVRVGNGAWKQRQLDVYGELLDAACRLRDQLDELGPGTADFLPTSPTRPPRAGRTGPGHLGGARRAAALPPLQADVLGGAGPRHRPGRRPATPTDRVADWKQARDRSGRRDPDEAGASAPGLHPGLRLRRPGRVRADDPIVGFLPGTIPGCGRPSRPSPSGSPIAGPGVPLRAADGLPGEEGAFLLCTFWLAHAQALAGRRGRARRRLRPRRRFANDLGLLAEEVDPDTGELLGNFPQAFSHIGLVNAAWAIRTAEDRDRRPGAG